MTTFSNQAAHNKSISTFFIYDVCVCMCGGLTLSVNVGAQSVSFGAEG